MPVIIAYPPGSEPVTPADLITLALKQCGVVGVGQSVTAEDMADAFRLLRMMLAQWQRQRWSVYTLRHIAIVADGSESYTIGPGGDIDTARPGKIESAFVRQLNTAPPNYVDYPLEILRAREDYDRIFLKSMASFPEYLFYESSYPQGKLYAWPIPDSQYELHLTMMEELQSFATPNDQIILPPEYQEAIMYNLALRLYPMYGLQVNPAVTGLAKASTNILKAANVQIPRLKLPASLTRAGVYNPYSDRVR